VDLNGSFALDDPGADPCLYAGEHVYVPGKSAAVVQVVGEVNRPREIELLPEDDLETLLKIAGGLRSNADCEAIQIIRGRSRFQPAEVTMAGGDIILVPAFHDTVAEALVTVFGAVERPGRYPFEENLVLSDIIALAGGFTEEAERLSTTIFRRAAADRWGRRSNHRYPIAVFARVTAAARPVALREDDSVYVPTSVGYVKVTGEVRNPGYFPFTPGKDIASYIEAAGSFLPRAERERIDVYDRISGMTTAHSPGTEVRDGDELVVEVREELK
jgi:protein involved in polysaccharide export with SLBB domain